MMGSYWSEGASGDARLTDGALVKYHNNYLHECVSTVARLPQRSPDISVPRRCDSIWMKCCTFIGVQPFFSHSNCVEDSWKHIFCAPHPHLRKNMGFMILRMASYVETLPSKSPNTPVFYVQVPQRETSRFNCSFYRLKWDFFFSSLIWTWDFCRKWNWKYILNPWKASHVMKMLCHIAQLDLHALLSPLPGLVSKEDALYLFRMRLKACSPVIRSATAKSGDFNTAIAQCWKIWIDSHGFFFSPTPHLNAGSSELLQCESVWALTEGSKGQFRDLLT